MTEPSKKRGRPPKAAAPSHIKITGKRVTGDAGRKHMCGDRLIVGEDCCPETAAIFVERGLAVVIDGLSPEATEQEIAEQHAAKLRQLTKQKADSVMTEFDRQSPETREMLRKTNGEIHDE